MQWGCPHCGVSLALSDDTMGTGWSFSKCYKCGGFALIRRTEINIIKVDKAPPGEKILLPEASIQPQEGLITSKATEKLARFQHQSTLAHLELAQSTPKTSTKLTPPSTPPNSADLTRVKRKKSLFIPVGISFATLAAIVSGAYLLKQWTTHDHPLFSKSTSIPVARPDLPIAPTPSIEVVPATHPITHFNTMQDPRIAANIAITPEIPKYSFSVTDLDDPESASPTATDTQVNQEHPLFLVKVRTNNAHVHSGPGMKYPVVKTITADTLYQVTHWNNRWFKISPTQGQSDHLTVKESSNNTASEIGWVRNDLVKVIHL